MGGRKARKELKFNALFLQGMRHLHESLKALAFDPRFDPDTIFREAFLNQEDDEEE